MSSSALSARDATRIGLSAGLLFVIISLTGLYEGIRAEGCHRAMQTWPSCQAIVEAAQIKPFRTGKHHDGSLYYETAITYRYRVNSIPYRSSYFCQGHGWQLGYPRSFDSREEAEKFLFSYKPGNKITVYYNPGLPGEAVIDRTFNANNDGKRGIMILSFFATGTILILCSLFRRRQIVPVDN